MAHQFACSKCFKRFPFEELSVGDQICKVSRKVDHLISRWVVRDFEAVTGSQWTPLAVGAGHKVQSEVHAYSFQGCQGPILPVKCQYCRLDFTPQQ